MIFFLMFTFYLLLLQNKPNGYLSVEGLEASSFDGAMSPGFEAVIRVFVTHLELLIRSVIRT